MQRSTGRGKVVKTTEIFYIQSWSCFKNQKSEGKVENGDILCLIALEGNVDIVRNLCKYLNQTLYFVIWY